MRGRGSARGGCFSFIFRGSGKELVEKQSDVRCEGCGSMHTSGMVLSYLMEGGVGVGGWGAKALFALTRPIEYKRHP